jgi:hypothetical protein
MSESYSVYWSQDRWRRLAAYSAALTVLFGGPHTSGPSFRTATVQAGDVLYPIGARGGVLYVFARMRVRQIVEVDEIELEAYFADHPMSRLFAPFCTTEVVFGTEGTRIHLDRSVPRDVLRRLTLQPPGGPSGESHSPAGNGRSISHVSDDGALLSPVSLQGICRLAEGSATDLESVLEGPPGRPINRPRLDKNPGAALGMEPLF